MRRSWRVEPSSSVAAAPAVQTRLQVPKLGTVIDFHLLTGAQSDLQGGRHRVEQRTGGKLILDVETRIHQPARPRGVAQQDAGRGLCPLGSTSGRRHRDRAPAGPITLRHSPCRSTTQGLTVRSC